MNSLEICKQNKGVTVLTVTLVMLTVLAVLAGATQAYAAGKKAKLKPEHEEFYHYARYLFTKNERKIFFGLPGDKARDQFIKYFWEIRDPNPMTEENEFKVELESRYEYASRRLKEGPVPGWKTDRGRIYIMLGAPSNTYEQTFGTGFGRAIYWYWEDSDIYIRFVDENGSGAYRMDFRVTSLRLLDELERRKYYIFSQDEEKEEFITDVLDFNLAYNKKDKEMRIRLNTKHLYYQEDKDSGLMIAKIKVNLVIYDKANNFTKYSDIKTIRRKPEELLEKKARLIVTFPLDLPPGKVRIDAIISDFLGDAVQRKFVKVKN
jgi:GWxTD domain-containing protein